MRVLLVESTPGNATSVRTWLERSGHETASCFEAPVDLRCRGVDHNEDCPLDRPTDLAVLVRDLDGGARSLTEMGAVCALRHRVHLVELVEPDLQQLDATMLAALAEASLDSPSHAYERVVRAAIDIPVEVSVSRSQGRVHALVEISADVDESKVPMIVDKATRAIRAHDPYVKIIDVGVRRD